MRRGWAVTTGLLSVLVVAGVVGWLWVANNPTLTLGSFGGPGPGVKVGAYPVSSSPRWVMDGDKAVLVESIRNAGNVPVTLSGVFADAQTLLDVHAQFQPAVYTDGLGIGGLDHRTTDTVTLAPEHEAGLVLTVTARPCTKRADGPMLFGGVSVITRTLGITTTQLIYFTDPYLIVPGLGPGSTCVEGPTDSQP